MRRGSRREWKLGDLAQANVLFHQHWVGEFWDFCSLQKETNEDNCPRIAIPKASLCGYELFIASIEQLPRKRWGQPVASPETCIWKTCSAWGSPECVIHYYPSSGQAFIPGGNLLSFKCLSVRKSRLLTLYWGQPNLVSTYSSTSSAIHEAPIFIHIVWIVENIVTIMGSSTAVNFRICAYMSSCLRIGCFYALAGKPRLTRRICHTTIIETYSTTDSVLSLVLVCDVVGESPICSYSLGWLRFIIFSIFLWGRFGKTGAKHFELYSRVFIQCIGVDVTGTGQCANLAASPAYSSAASSASISNHDTPSGGPLGSLAACHHCVIPLSAMASI